jgi:hypothetical protein
MIPENRRRTVRRHGEDEFWKRTIDSECREIENIIVHRKELSEYFTWEQIILIKELKIGQALALKN